MAETFNLNEQPVATTPGALPPREPLRNEFSWSRSRAAIFDTCRRQYYYAYYGSWGGWEADAPTTTRQLYVLKQLKTRQMWAGEVVHGVIERAIRDLRRGITKPRVEDVVAMARARMRRDFSNSRARRYWQQPKTLGLAEHEFGIEVADADWADNAEHVALCIRNFYASDTFRRLADFTDDDYLEVERLSTFSVAGTKVWVKLDVALRAGATVVVIDWKTGRSDRDDFGQQLACYALYCGQRWGVEPHNIQALVENLALGERETLGISEAAVRATRSEIVASADAMRGLLSDALLNVPEAEEAFALAETDAPCRFCNYRSACPKISPAAADA